MSNFFIIGYILCMYLYCATYCVVGIEYFEFPHDVSGEIE